MSGYNKSTGIFELTFTKARYWFRRVEFSDACTKYDPEKDMDFYGCLLANAGLPVVHVNRAFLQVKARPGQVWEALSGRPSDPEHEAYYLKNTMHQSNR